MSCYWIHGHDARIENDDALRATWRAGFFARFAGRSGRSAWVHYAVGTPLEILGQTVKLEDVQVRYRTGASDAWIAAVHVYDGENRLVAHDGLLDASPEWKVKRLQVPGEHELHHAVGVSLHLVFGHHREAERDDRAHVVEIAGVGAGLSDPTLIRIDRPILGNDVLLGLHISP